MSVALTTHPLRTTVADFVVGLHSLEKEPITKPLVLDYLSQVNLNVGSLSRYLFWNDDLYTRNLIYRDEMFEVLALCWRPGHKTTVHAHNGQLGWVTVLQGEILDHAYRDLGCCSSENVVRIDRLPKSRNIELQRVHTTSFVSDRRVATVDKHHAIHQMENAEKSRAGSVSLHIYSKPIDSCLAFDLEKKRSRRRTLCYYSWHGVRVAS